MSEWGDSVPLCDAMMVVRQGGGLAVDFVFIIITIKFVGCVLTEAYKYTVSAIFIYCCYSTLLGVVLFHVYGLRFYAVNKKIAKKRNTTNAAIRQKISGGNRCVWQIGANQQNRWAEKYKKMAKIQHTSFCDWLYDRETAIQNAFNVCELLFSLCKNERTECRYHTCHCWNDGQIASEGKSRNFSMCKF